MMNMKKLLALTVALLLAVVPAMAAEVDLSNRSITSGNVAAAHFVDITAPCSGTLESFDLTSGDAVSSDDLLFTMMTTNITAPEDGVVSCVVVQNGELASDAMNRYGYVIGIDPDVELQLVCDTSGAANKEENKKIHLGEKLFFQSSKGDKNEGSGIVINVKDSTYVVDILTGEFDMKESLTMYRSSDYKTNENVGKGTVVRRNPVTVPAGGRVAEVMTAPGLHVNKGDVLLKVLSDDADAGASPRISAPADGVIAMVAVNAGQTVWKGQLLARIYLTNVLEIVADVDEMDLHGLAVGDSVPVTLDMDAGTVYNGKVSEISSLGYTKQNAAYFTVHVALNNIEMPLGASASIYLPR